MSDKGKEFIFPRNVNKDYGIFKYYTIKDGIRMVPVLLGGLLFIILPPHHIILMLIKIGVFSIILTVLLARTAARPVKGRENIRMQHYTNMRRKYAHMQKRYYIKPKAVKGIFHHDF